MKNSKAYIWSFVGKFGSQVLYLLTTLVLARLLSPDDFGIIGVLSVIFMVANTLSESGLGGALLMEKELKAINCSTIFVFNVSVSAFLYMLIFFCAPLIENFYNINGLSNIARVLGLVFVINSWGLVPRTVLLFKLQFKRLAIISLVGVICASAISIVMAFMNLGVYALVGYQLSLAIWTTLLLVYNSHYRFSFSFDYGCFKRMFSFGLFTTLTGVIDSIYENMMAAVFGKFMNVAQAGYLTQAKKIEEASSQALILTINTTSFPILSKLKDDIEHFKKEANALQKTIPLVIGPVLVILCVYSDFVISLMFGEKWIESASYLSLLVIAGYFMMNESINRNFIKSLGEVKRLFHYTILKRLFGIILILVLAFINVDYILFGYILSSFIAFIINSCLYANIIRENCLRTIWNSLKYQLCIFSTGVLVFFIHSYSPNWTFEMIFLIISIILYLFIIKKMGINIWYKR